MNSKSTPTPLLTAHSRSQHIEGFFQSSAGGPRACTPTSLAFAYRFLRLSQLNKLPMNKEFFKHQLEQGIERGVAINNTFSFRDKLARKSTHDVFNEITAYNLLNLHSPCEIGAIEQGKEMLATNSPESLVGDPAVIDFLPTVLEKFLNSEDGVDTASIVTCSGHTTVLLHLKNNYYCINSADNFFKTKLEIHDTLDSLQSSLLITWGNAAKEVAFTGVTLRSDLTSELIDAYDLACGIIENAPICAPNV